KKVSCLDKGFIVSVGVVNYFFDAALVKEFLAKADEAIYLAKRLKKNQTEILTNDQHHFQRIPVNTLAKCTFPTQPSKPVMVKNLSEEKFLVQMPNQIQKKIMLDLKLALNTSNKTMKCMGRVTHVQEQADRSS